MRKGFDGLCGIIYSQLKSDPLSGDVYLFMNRRRDRIKMLVWDRGGFWLLYKRLESGRFQFLQPAANENSVEITYDILLMLIEGIDIGSIRRKKRYNG